MPKTYRILALNPKSSATIVGLYVNESCIVEMTVEHHVKPKRPFHEQASVRCADILERIAEEGLDLSKLNAVVGRGGLLRPIEGGTYEINDAMMEDLESGFGGKHPSNFGGVVAKIIADHLQIPSYIVDPVVVDELSGLARMTGLPEIKRKSIFHALNQKSAARKAAKELGLEYDKARFIIVSVSGGITIGAHEKGLVIDVNNGLDGDGPLSAERAGTLPAGTLISMCFSGEWTKEEMIRKVTQQGGLKAYLGTGSLEEAEARLISGDRKASLVYEAMVYQVAKEIGAMATVLNGNIDAIVFSGKVDRESPLIQMIAKRISWIADFLVFPGENELASLAAGALRVLQGAEQAKVYQIAEGV